MTLDERIIEAQRRISAGLAPMRIPADQCDPDIVLSACQATIAELVTALERIAFEPQGHAEATADQVLDAVTTIARAALAKAKESANG